MTTLDRRLETLQAQSEPALMRVVRNGRTREQREAARDALVKLRAARRQVLLAEFNAATAAFLDYTDQLRAVIDAIEAAPPGGGSLTTLNGLLAAATTVYAGLRDPERLASATEEGEVTITLPVRDGEAAAPAAAPAAAALAARADGGFRLPPLNSRSFADLRDEYAAYFRAAEIRSERAGDLAFYLARLRRHRARYEAVGDPLGIPWYFIGCIHALEGGFDFGTHLFNGDPLAARTVRVPKGQPAAPPEAGEGRPYTWEESARAAMRLKGFGGLTDWSLPRLLYRWEAYNGFGYRPRGVPTPYLWSFSTVYTSGRYVADHRFDRNAVSKQAGAATMLSALAAEVDLPLAA